MTRNTGPAEWVGQRLTPASGADGFSRIVARIRGDHPLESLLDRPGQQRLLHAVIDGLPDWGRFLDALVHDLRRQGAVVVSAFPVEEDHLLIALSASLGLVTSEGSTGADGLVYDVQPHEYQPGELVRPSLVTAAFAPHTDSLPDAIPHRWVSLGCVVASETGGESELVRLDDVITALTAARGEQHLRTLSQPVPWAHPLVKGHEPCIWWHPAIEDVDGGTRVRWREDMLWNGLALTGRESQPIASAANAFSNTVQELAAACRFRLGPGQVLILDNWRLIHGRSALGDLRRHLKRTKIAV